MLSLKNIYNYNSHFNPFTENGNHSKSTFLKIGLIIPGILCIISAVVNCYYLGVNVIASYGIGSLGGILILSSCLISCIQGLGKKRNDLDVELNFNKIAGSHTSLSPVVGTRYRERRAVQEKMHQWSILHNLERAIFQSQMFYLIPFAKMKEADEISKSLFLDYISKYSSQGITLENIVHWIHKESVKVHQDIGLDDEDLMAEFSFYNGTLIRDDVDSGNTWRVTIHVTIHESAKSDCYFPPYVVALHEIMHAEEIPQGIKSSFQKQAGTELLSAVQTVMLLDSICKRIYNLSEKDVVDYGKIITLRDKLIPLGEFVNFYRSLEQKYGALYQALVSTESISYLSSFD